MGVGGLKLRRSSLRTSLRWGGSQVGTISGCSHEMTTVGALEQQLGGGVLRVVEEQWSERSHLTC